MIDFIFEENVQLSEKYIECLKNVVSNILEVYIGNVNVNFIFVSKHEITQMNEEYRKKEGPTDVLTFVYDEDIYAESYICLDVVKENAQEFGNTFEKELAEVIIHSTLHMIGYDHEYDKTKADEMFKLQAEYLKNFLECSNIV